MTSTHLLRCQHADAIAMIGRLLDQLNSYGGPLDAYAITLQLAKLTQLMRVHFAQEDDCLYPALIGSSDPEVADAAKAFQCEIGELWEHYERFIRRWSTSETIAAGFEEFRTEGIVIFDAIEERCTRENELLFPLADTLAARQLGHSPRRDRRSRAA